MAHAQVVEVEPEVEDEGAIGADPGMSLDIDWHGKHFPERTEPAVPCVTCGFYDGARKHECDEPKGVAVEESQDVLHVLIREYNEKRALMLAADRSRERYNDLGKAIRVIADLFPGRLEAIDPCVVTFAKEQKL